MLDVTNRNDVQKGLESAQESDQDNRDQIKEVDLFRHKKDGQWEPSIIAERGSKRPRYTFDLCNPVVDQVASPLQKSEFAIKIRPAGGDASKKIAETYAGLIRNTENLSKAKTLVYNPAIKRVVASGLAGWELKQKFADQRSMNQDILIDPINNITESAWIDEHSLLQDNSDAKVGWRVIPLSRDVYEKRWPKGTMQSIGTNQRTHSYTDKPEFITVAKFFYLKTEKVKLVEMSNGRVYEKESKEYQKIKDELKAADVTEENERDATVDVCFQRFYDGSDWLAKEERTAFNHIPLVFVYGNFEIIENKIIYSGEVLHLMDSQRVLNYSETKKVEETALSAKEKVLATAKQIGPYAAEWKTMNTDNKPVLRYAHDPEAMGPPTKLAGSSINPGLESVSQNMRQNIQASSGLFAANMGDNQFRQSGVAIERQVDQGNEGKYDYFNAFVIAFERTAQILIGAYPTLMDTKQQRRVLNQDGTFDMVTLHEPIRDRKTGEIVETIDLSKGIYDVTYDVGPGYKNQQEATIDAFLKMGEIDPSFIQQGKDIMVNQINAPGMSDMHERIREQMVTQNQIPFEQMTDDEKAKVQQAQAQQQEQPDPIAMAAQGALLEGQAALQDSQNKQVEIQGDQQFKMAELQLNRDKLELDNKRIDLDTQKFLRAGDDKFGVDAAKIAQGQQALDLKADQQLFDQQKDIIDQQQKALNDAVNNLKTLREASGIETIIGVGNLENIEEQTEIVGGKLE